MAKTSCDGRIRGKYSEQLTNSASCLQRVSERAVVINAIVISAPLTFPFNKACAFQFGDDF